VVRELTCCVINLKQDYSDLSGAWLSVCRRRGQQSTKDPPGFGLPFSGTITTDGNTTIPLSASDITSWNITLPGIHFPITLNPTNSTLSLTPGALTATATALLFNFSDTAASQLTFSSISNPGNYLSYPDSASPCTIDFSTTFSDIVEQLTEPGCCNTQTTSGPLSGTTEIASAPAATPLPAALPLFAPGLGVMGLLGWRRKRKPAAKAVA
jgi:hypothetical protein